MGQVETSTSSSIKFHLYNKPFSFHISGRASSNEAVSCHEHRVLIFCHLRCSVRFLHLVNLWTSTEAKSETCTRIPERKSTFRFAVSYCADFCFCVVSLQEKCRPLSFAPFHRIQAETDIKVKKKKNDRNRFCCLMFTSWMQPCCNDIYVHILHVLNYESFFSSHSSSMILIQVHLGSICPNNFLPVLHAATIKPWYDCTFSNDTPASSRVLLSF